MMLQFHFGPLFLHSSNSVLLLEPAQKPFYTLNMASPVNCTICHNLNVGRITIYSNCGHYVCGRERYLQLHHMASIATGMCLWWLLFSFFFLPLHCHVVYAHFEQSSQCANRYACKHRLLYLYAYVNYDSTLHKIPNWCQLLCFASSGLFI